MDGMAHRLLQRLNYVEMEKSQIGGFNAEGGTGVGRCAGEDQLTWVELDKKLVISERRLVDRCNWGTGLELDTAV